MTAHAKKLADEIRVAFKGRLEAHVKPYPIEELSVAEVMEIFDRTAEGIEEEGGNYVPVRSH